MSYLLFPPLGPKGRKKAIEKGLANIVGQEEAKAALFDVLDAALSRHDHACPVRLLVTGPAGEGKTTLVKTMATILSVPFVELDGSQLKNINYLAKEILEALAKAHKLPPACEENKEAAFYYIPPTIILIDEAHAMSVDMQTSLLKATEANDGMLLATRAKLILNCSQVTWIMATTNPGDFTGPLVSRFAFEIPLYRSTAEQVAEIVFRKYQKKGFTPEACNRIVYYSGRIPRVALIFAEKVHLHMRSQKLDALSAVEAIARRDRIDMFGMRYEWRRILELLNDHEQGLLLRELVSHLECDEKRLKNDYLLALMLKPTARTSSLITRDDRYFITQEGRNWLRCPYPLFASSEVIARSSNSTLTLVVEQFGPTFYYIACYDLAGNILEAVTCETVEEAKAIFDTASAQYSLGQEAPNA
jgi:Holliday junction resolvasome RuvABC ATP-dependent DNA helicase subunit